MANDNPYSVPFCNAFFNPLYGVLSKLGDHRVIISSEIWENIDTATTFPADEKFAFIVNPLSDTSHVIHTTSPLLGHSSLIFEQNTGSIILCPEPLIQSTTLSATTKWPGNTVDDDSSDAATWTGVGSAYTDTQNLNNEQTWTPIGLDDVDLELHPWYEWKFDLPSIYQGSDYLTGADKTGEALKAIGFDAMRPDVGDPMRHVVSDFQLNANASFFLAFKLHDAVKYNRDDPNAPLFQLIWGESYVFEYRAGYMRFTDKGADAVEQSWVDVTGVSRGTGFPLADKDKEVVFLLFQVLSNTIVIHNAQDFAGKGDKKRAQPSRGWAFNALSSSFEGISVPADYVKVGFRGASGWFSFFPCVYVTEGKITSRDFELGHPVTNLELTTQKFIPEDDGGNDLGEVTEDGTISGGGTKYRFEVTLTRDTEVTNRTPELYGVTADSDPIFSVAGFNFPSLEDRIMSVDINLGVLDHSATVLVDNTDGAFKDQVGMFPFTIETGWYRKDGSVASGTRFFGFVERIDTKKTDSISTATFSCIGRKAQLEDAKAVNLPIYDGFVHVTAIQDLLKRSGYPDYAGMITSRGTPLTATDANFKLPLPLPSESPIFNFALGTSIWSCIAEIARQTGYWYFFSPQGTFYYCPPFIEATVRTFQEIATAAGTYDELYALSELKDTSDVRNAVLILGLDQAPKVPIPISWVYHADLTNTTVPGYIPWLRWVIIPDAKINNVAVAQFMGTRIVKNLARPRYTCSFKTWGQHDLNPLDSVGINLINDTIGLPTALGPPIFRVLAIHDNLDFKQGMYTSVIDVEYHDPVLSRDAWWDPQRDRGS